MTEDRRRERCSRELTARAREATLDRDWRWPHRWRRSAPRQPAVAGLQQEFAIFSDCPVENPAVATCVVSTTTSGEFKIGNKTVPVNMPVVLQGGLTRTLAQPRAGGRRQHALENPASSVPAD